LSLCVDPCGIEFVTDKEKLFDRWRLCQAEILGDLRVPAHVRSNLLQRNPRMQGLQRHLARGLGEPVRAEVGDDRGGPAAEPATPGIMDGIPAVAGGRPEVELIDERALRLAHDHQDPPRVDRDLARAARPGQTDLRVRIVADHRGVEVAEAVDLRAPEERDVDQTGLEVEGEQLVHRRDGGGARDQGRIPDRKRQTLRSRTVGPRLVDELQLGRDRALSQVANDVRQSDPDEAVPHPEEVPRARHDHHLGLRVTELAHAYLP
jgi:hypothetical protein